MKEEDYHLLKICHHTEEMHSFYQFGNPLEYTPEHGVNTQGRLPIKLMQQWCGSAG